MKKRLEEADLKRRIAVRGEVDQPDRVAKEAIGSNGVEAKRECPAALGGWRRGDTIGLYVDDLLFHRTSMIAVGIHLCAAAQV